MKKWIFISLLGAGAAIINGLIVFEALRVLTLTGAAAAQGGSSFSFYIILYGPAAAILAITGLQVSHMQGLRLNHPFVTFMLANILLPFAIYGIFLLRMW